MGNCYDCQAQLTPLNSSGEHILQNSVGGQLKAPLLCNSCNREMGADADAALAASMNVFANMLDIKRDRGDPQPIPGTIKRTGERILIDPGGKPRLRDTKIEVDEVNGTVSFRIQAPSLKEARKHLKGLKRKYPKLDVEDALRSMSVSTVEPGEQMQGQIDVGDASIFRAVTKAALNFYLHVGGQREQVEALIPYIKAGMGNAPVGFFYPEEPIFEETKRDVLHRMFLVGEPEERILYCVVTYFSTMSYVVLLNGNYLGPALAYHHTLNPVLGHSEPRKVLRSLSRVEVEAAISALPDKPIDQARTRIERILRLAAEKQATMHECERLIEQAFASTPARQDEILSDYAMRIFHAMEPGLMPMIRAASARRRAEAEAEFRKAHGIPEGQPLVPDQV